MTSRKPRLTPFGQPRYFTSCDAARIARNVVADRNERPEEVLACVAKGLGFTHISLSRPTEVVESGVNISKGTVKTTITLTKSLLNTILKRFPRYAERIAVIIEALDKFERVIDKLLDTPPSERVEDVLPPGKCNCKDQPKVEEDGN